LQHAWEQSKSGKKFRRRNFSRSQVSKATEGAKVMLPHTPQLTLLELNVIMVCVATGTVHVYVHDWSAQIWAAVASASG
jgi:hypothetical protein